MCWAEEQTVTYAPLERVIYGQAGFPEWQAIRQAIYRHRTRLGPLGWVVDRVPGLGYRLSRELPTEPQSLSIRYGPVIAL
jgi:DNA-binding response OmpR family regulator